MPPVEREDGVPEVVLVVGVNGTGQDYDDRKAGADAAIRGQDRPAVRGGHVSGGGD